MELCGTDIPMVPGKQPPAQLPLPSPACPTKGTLGSAVLSKDVQIGDALLLIYPDFTGPRAELPTPQIFSVNTSCIQVGVSSV